MYHVSDLVYGICGPKLRSASLDMSSKVVSDSYDVVRVPVLT
jgi:hypothetical protein